MDGGLAAPGNNDKETTLDNKTAGLVCQVYKYEFKNTLLDAYNKIGSNPIKKIFAEKDTTLIEKWTIAYNNRETDRSATYPYPNKAIALLVQRTKKLCEKYGIEENHLITCSPDSILVNAKAVNKFLVCYLDFRKKCSDIETYGNQVLTEIKAELMISPESDDELEGKNCNSTKLQNIVDESKNNHESNERLQKVVDKLNQDILSQSFGELEHYDNPSFNWADQQ